MESKNYSKIDDLLCKLAHKLSAIPCLPVNYYSEKEKFFKKEGYNPLFKYEAPSPSISYIKQILKEMSIDDRSMGSIFSRKRDELVRIAEMMESIGSTRLTEISKSLYGTPSRGLVEKAWSLIKIHDLPENMFISSKQVRVWLEHAMKRYGFDWKVKEREMAAKACVECATKTLFIRENSFFTRKFLNRLIVHEIGTHIMRHENGKKQPYSIFALGLKDYVATEEGLAVANEELNHCLTRSTLKTYAARVIAIDKGLKCTFSETFHYLLPFVGKENAFEITMRVKRGLGNTMWAGAFTKDYLYLKGFFDVRKFIANKGDIKELYYGKVGLDDLKSIRSIKGLINPLFFQTMKHYTPYYNK
jgi:uncharacterized protein (TIGR02421 family)